MLNGKNFVTLDVDNCSSSKHSANRKIYFSTWCRPNAMIRWFCSNSRCQIFSWYYKIKRESLHYNKSNSLLYTFDVKQYQFKDKDSEINSHPRCLDNISKGFTADGMTKIGLNGYMYNVLLINIWSWWIKWWILLMLPI